MCDFCVEAGSSRKIQSIQASSVTFLSAMVPITMSPNPRPVEGHDYRLASRNRHPREARQADTPPSWARGPGRFPHQPQAAASTAVGASTPSFGQELP